MTSSLQKSHPLLWEELVHKDTSLSAGSKKKVTWRCASGHEWDAVVCNRTYNSTGCSFCSGRFPIKGETDLSATHPEIFEQLVDKSLVLKPKSHQKVAWRCSKGHVWDAIVSSRTKGSGCPFCSRRKPLVGVTDLRTTYPEIAAELVDQSLILSTHSASYVEWKCAKGHLWSTHVYKRTQRKAHGCPFCSGREPIVGETDLQTTDPEIYNEQVDKTIVVSRGSSAELTWRCIEGHEWSASVYQRTAHRSGCPSCFSTAFRSKAEVELSEWVESLGLEVQTNTRNILKGIELDLYIPEKALAVEYNGLYWHSEWNHDKWYHHNKWKKCKEAGIQLIQIWEDQWIDRKSMVKDKLQSMLLGRASVGARTTYSCNLSYAEASDFLDETHLQGRSSGSSYLGLRDKKSDQILAVSVFKRTKETIYLERYASRVSIVGGLDKMMTANGPGRYTTFADHCISNGNLYEKTGWEVEQVLDPDYRYVRSGVKIREHKFNYRLKRFRTDPTLEYVDGYSESQLAELNNIYRIWDAGKTRYIKHVE